MAIEAILDQIMQVDWDIVPRFRHQIDRPTGTRQMEHEQIDAVELFLDKPNRNNYSWDQILRMLIRNILSHKMPPPGTNAPVTAAELEALRQWIDKARFTARPQVAALRETFTPAEAPEVAEKDRQSWAFRKPVAQPIPKVKNQQQLEALAGRNVVEGIITNDIHTLGGEELASLRQNYPGAAFDKFYGEGAYLSHVQRTR